MNGEAEELDQLPSALTLTPQPIGRQNFFNKTAVNQPPVNIRQRTMTQYLVCMSVWVYEQKR